MGTCQGLGRYVDAANLDATHGVDLFYQN